MSELKPCPFCGNEYSLMSGEMAEGSYILQPGFVFCCECGAEISECKTEAEAIEAWNRRAERTAKVVSDDVIITVNGYRYHYEEYLCNACKKKVISCDSYCSHCGAKLDWSWNE